MLALTSDESSSLLPLSQARVPVVIRAGELRDVPFMDSLQKMHAKMVGFFPTAQFEGNIRAGRVLIAEEVQSDECRVQNEEGSGDSSSSLCTHHSALCTCPRTPVGYCIAADRYFKHDDVGIIYQMNVKPGRQRSLVGAMLLKAQFERSAYGCKLYCCWCAQDIAANKFWEAMGFVPLAFRTGSASKSRIHIFWQKRIRRGDVSTPWWFPSETSGGAVKENRVVLPIPPGTHWSDAKPLVLPGIQRSDVSGQRSENALASSSLTSDLRPLTSPRKRAKPKKELVVVNPRAISAGGLRFATTVPSVIEEKVEVKEKKPKQKNDPRLVAAARELKDRWLEEINSGQYLPMANGKYEVCRGIEGPRQEMILEPAERVRSLPSPMAA
jgi:hypothetical protein